MVKYLPTCEKKTKIINFVNDKILDPHPTQPVISTQEARNIEIS